MNGKQPSPVDRPLTVNPPKLGGTGKATSAPTPVQRLDGQPFTLSTSARGHDLPTAGRAHAPAETVALRPLATVRLVSALHGTPSRNLSMRPIRTSISEPGNPSNSTAAGNCRTTYLLLAPCKERTDKKRAANRPLHITKNHSPEASTTPIKPYIRRSTGALLLLRPTGVSFSTGCG